MKYIHIDFRCDDADEQGWQLVDAGASGIEILDDTSVRAFIESNPEKKLTAFCGAAKAAGFVELSRAAVPDLNWTQLSPELLASVRIGAVRITPVATAQDVPRVVAADELVLIPGQGFGTGHHPSTRQALLLLQHPAVRNLAGRNDTPRVCDFGTGSGILAITSAKRLGAAVHAIDISEDALLNAAENARLNRCEKSISFETGSIGTLSGRYALTTANIYAELLVEFEPVFRKHSAMLLCAGILAERFDDVCAEYEQHWQIETTVSSEGWTAALFSSLLLPAL